MTRTSFKGEADRSHRVTLSTYGRINALNPTGSYAVAFDGKALARMSGQELANRLRMSNEPERLTYHRLSPR